MKKVFPKHLNIGDEIRVIAPSSSLGIISEDVKKIANERFASLGLKLSFGNHVAELDEFNSSSIKSRVSDLHDAFSDSNVKAIVCVIGGFNCNQLLGYIDWSIIKRNPKILCGYSDVTILNNAILTKTGLVSYSGPCYSTFGQKLYFDYTLEHFKKCLISDSSFDIIPSNKWRDDVWYKNQNDMHLIDNEGCWIINKGKAEGVILGGNLCTFNLLQGTEYFPKLKNSIIFLEDDEDSNPRRFDRDLQSLIHLPDFKHVKGIVIGKFQKASVITKDILIEIVKNKKELNNLPVIANVDFGHTSPIITFPIGGIGELVAIDGKLAIKIIKH